MTHAPKPTLESLAQQAANLHDRIHQSIYSTLSYEGVHSDVRELQTWCLEIAILLASLADAQKDGCRE